MRHKRLYSPKKLAGLGELLLPKFEANYLLKVLRLRIGDSLRIFDGNGGEYAARIDAQTRNSVTLELGEFYARDCESNLTVTLLQAISRGERMDHVVQKATELGVTEVVPVFSEHGQVRLTAERAMSRQQHWIAIARNACQQCGRNVVPAIASPRSLADALAQVDPVTLRIVLEPGQPANWPVSAPQSIALAIGPEGGFSAGELDLARGLGYQTLGLGPRVLRTETAASAALAALQVRYGDF